MNERVSLPPRPADGGGLPSSEADLAARLRNASDIVLQTSLERDIRDEKILRSRLDFVQMKIRVTQAEKARRNGVILDSGGDYF